MRQTAARRPRLAIVAPDLPRALARGAALRGLFDPLIVESRRPLRDAMRAVGQQPDCVITRLSAGDSVVEVRDLVFAAGAVPILFLADVLPLRAALARVIDAAGDAVLCESETTAVVEATLIALLARRRDAT
jgi:hypothetical protein